MELNLPLKKDICLTQAFRSHFLLKEDRKKLKVEKEGSDVYEQNEPQIEKADQGELQLQLSIGVLRWERNIGKNKYLISFKSGDRGFEDSSKSSTLLCVNDILSLSQSDDLGRTHYKIGSRSATAKGFYLETNARLQHLVITEEDSVNEDVVVYEPLFRCAFLIRWGCDIDAR
ncbi:hypothetical protein Tco_1344440 [Tanacetum coccineum]